MTSNDGNAAHPLPPIMSSAEFSLYVSKLRNARAVLEFGVGGSTIAAVRAGVPVIHGVDSSVEWIDKVRENARAFMHPEQQLNLHFVDIGPVREGGWPIGPKSQWADYFKSVWPDVDETVVDLFLVDGRFRVCCALECALRANRDALIAIHDFSTRPFYSGVLGFLDLVDHADSLSLFKVKSHLDRVAIEAVIAAKAADPS